MPGPLDLLRIAYGDLSEALSALSEEEQWAPTGCRGWTPVDLGHHLLGDARRALVALSSPAPGPADTDRVTYWRGWRPPAAGDDEDLRRTRAAASTGLPYADLVRAYSDTTDAVLVSAGRVRPDEPVRTQGHVLAVDDLLSTLVVEAAVHHLDLVAHLGRPGPGEQPLGEVRRVLEGLLGRPLPTGWDDVTAARRGTGREPLTDADRTELGDDAEAFPLFG
ncbi:maleylpyruvate isomerase N-terminal domain-containing protein [Blastococcus haudaquaticus]|uniref:TIGR03083 family protein n=1 Tax=Blastococcus haudaquaticus TaxID=1938745 RepID=A0A286H0Y5_9ACTN|nr:maleylpyruvate isomerase N-terminal domain-containing protein [Blastococcus haudaquaticus]SOE01116.1 TIGR03083 family protein [Blastococcus haudaquaticus]